MLVRRSAIDAAGLIPEAYFMYAEDLDWCFQIRRSGFEVWFTDKAAVMHAGNESAGQLPSRWGVEKRFDSKYIFCRRAYGPFQSKLIELTDLVAQTIRLPLYRIKAKRDDSMQPVVERMEIARASASRAFLGI